MNQKTADAVNILGQFCGIRDIDRPDRSALREKYGFDRADVFVLFGGSILAGGDVLAQGIREGIAKTFVIAGGEGHTTQTLRETVHKEFPGIETEGAPEAEIFQRYLKEAHSLEADLLETGSTNCGNNITNLLGLLKENRIGFSSIILCQDATMQRRMDAVLRKYVRTGVEIINFASYKASTAVSDGKLCYSEAIHGMWSMERYVNLLMGEIPRLRDDAAGYGPNGKGFLAHVDIPDAVSEAFELLKTVFGAETRPACPEYASDK